MRRTVRELARRVVSSSSASSSSASSAATRRRALGTTLEEMNARGAHAETIAAYESGAVSHTEANTVEYLKALVKEDRVAGSALARAVRARAQGLARTGPNALRPAGGRTKTRVQPRVRPLSWTKAESVGPQPNG